MSRSSPPELNRLADSVQHKAVIWHEALRAPMLSEKRASAVEASLLEEAAEFAARLPCNEEQAIHDGDSAQLRRSTREDGVITYQRLPFSVVMALRAQGHLPRFIAASAIPVDYERRTLVLHRRGPSMKTYPDAIHTVGGAFVPGEDVGLFQSLQRECGEEAGIEIARDLAFSDPGYVPSILIGEELSTGSVQIVYLHRSFQRVGDPRCSARAFDEGTPVFLGFDELPEILEYPQWVPSGRLHVLAWLRQLAFHPGCSHLHARFARRDAHELLTECLSRPWKAPDNAVVIG